MAGASEGRAAVGASARGRRRRLCARRSNAWGSCSRCADYEPPQALLHWMLVGPWQGRRALVARLGREANDPIDELLNAALAYAGAHTPSLLGFIQWFDAGEGELKREAGASDGLVRVMTVHGAKGLAGADRDPGRCCRQSRQLAGARAGAGRTTRQGSEERRRLPLPGADQGREGRAGSPRPRPRPRGGARGALAAALCRDDPRGRGAVHRRLAWARRRRASRRRTAGTRGLRRCSRAKAVGDPIWGEWRELGERASAAACVGRRVGAEARLAAARLGDRADWAGTAPAAPAGAVGAGEDRGPLRRSRRALRPRRRGAGR